MDSVRPVNNRTGYHHITTTGNTTTGNTVFGRTVSSGNINIINDSIDESQISSESDDLIIKTPKSEISINELSKILAVFKDFLNDLPEEQKVNLWKKHKILTDLIDLPEICKEIEEIIDL